MSVCVCVFFTDRRSVQKLYGAILSGTAKQRWRTGCEYALLMCVRPLFDFSHYFNLNHYSYSSSGG